MPKKQNLDASYLEWANDLPEDLRGPAIEKFLTSAAAERIANLHGGMTRAQQRAQELEARESRYHELDTWANTHSDLYQRLPEWASIIRSRKPEDVERALTGARQDLEQQATDVDAAFQAGTLTYDQALPIVVDLRKKYGALNGQVEEFKKFRETDVPQFVGAVEQNLAALRTRQDNSNQSLLAYVADLVDYTRVHPDRTARKIHETFVERNKERQYKTFGDIAADAYGEADTEQMIEQRTAERLDAQQKARDGTTEAPVTGSAIGPFRRQHVTVKPPPATTQGGMRTALLEHFQKT